jgi:hypothetical protein
VCIFLDCCPRIIHTAAHASTATAAEIAKCPSVSGFEHLFQDTCDVDVVGDGAVREPTPKRLQIEESFICFGNTI